MISRRSATKILIFARLISATASQYLAHLPRANPIQRARHPALAGQAWYEPTSPPSLAT
jgi:hypothetical protein